MALTIETLTADTGWNMNSNGRRTDLVIQQIEDGPGNLTGTVFGDPIQGFWDHGAQKITFLHRRDINNPFGYQIYTGYGFHNPIEPEAGDNVTYTLAGYFQAFRAQGGTARRNLFGWVARLEQVG